MIEFFISADVLTFLCTALLPKLPQTRLEDALLCHMFPHVSLKLQVGFLLEKFEALLG